MLRIAQAYQRLNFSRWKVSGKVLRMNSNARGNIFSVAGWRRLIRRQHQKQEQRIYSRQDQGKVARLSPPMGQGIMNLKKNLQHCISRHRRSKVLRFLDNAAVLFHKAYSNLDYDCRYNGETRILEILQTLGTVRTVLDVGANAGEWTRLAAALLPKATIHAFEIVPRTYQELKQKCAGISNLVLNGFGLADYEGNIKVFSPPTDNCLATCVEGFTEGFHQLQPDSLEAKVTTGDLYCSGKGLSEIDLLKLDVEGFEHRVLKGFQRLFESSGISAVQFEYGYVNIAERFLLRDFYDFFAGLKMRVGKIYPTYVDFRGYQYRDEDFLGPNYLAVSEKNADLLDLLA